MTSFDAISQYYDDMINSRKIDDFYIELVRPYQSNDSLCVLDLGCGTGAFLSKIKATTKVGVDISYGMISQAKAKVPEGKFYVSSLNDFCFTELTYDCVVSMYDVINMLQRFSEWENLFSHVAKSLKPGGIFAFDINDVKRQDYLCEHSPMIKKIKNDYSITEITKIEEEKYKWETLYFRFVKDGLYILERMENIEYSPLNSDVFQVLKKFFAKVNCISPSFLDSESVRNKSFYICYK